jgi:hypothetical protein
MEKLSTMKKLSRDEMKQIMGGRELVIELCSNTSMRCREREDGIFIRQRFQSGGWQQISGTTSPTLSSCLHACAS